jgi:hypothetical protein
MRLWSMIVAAVTLAVVASAQASHHDSATMVLPIPGVPLSVETIEEYVTKDPDGTSTSRIDKNKVYRDAAGRVRREWEVRDPFGDPLVMILLADPVEGFVAVLETSTKIAHRVQGPKTGRPGEIGISMGPTGLVGVTGKTTRKAEDLAKQTIEEVEFEGTRTTTTSDEQPSLVAVDESWGSKELGLVGLVKHSGPDGEMTSRIQNMDRTAPDPALFVIPADYHIRDMVLPGPPQ